LIEIDLDENFIANEKVTRGFVQKFELNEILYSEDLHCENFKGKFYTKYKSRKYLHNGTFLTLSCL
jgi:hypothetical protein